MRISAWQHPRFPRFPQPQIPETLVTCVQGHTSSCRATLAATMGIGAMGEEEDVSEDEEGTRCSAAPYPQLPAGYDQGSFYVQLGKRDASAIDAQRGACFGSDAAAEPMKALLTVQTVPPAPSHHMACLQWRQRRTASPCLPVPSLAPSCTAENVMSHWKGCVHRSLIRPCLEWEASLMPE